MPASPPVNACTSPDHSRAIASTGSLVGSTPDGLHLFGARDQVGPLLLESRDLLVSIRGAPGGEGVPLFFGVVLLDHRHLLYECGQGVDTDPFRPLHRLGGGLQSRAEAVQVGDLTVDRLELPGDDARQRRIVAREHVADLLQGKAERLQRADLL